MLEPEEVDIMAPARGILDKEASARPRSCPPTHELHPSSPRPRDHTHTRTHTHALTHARGTRAHTHTEICNTDCLPKQPWFRESTSTLRCTCISYRVVFILLHCVDTGLRQVDQHSTKSYQMYVNNIQKGEKQFGLVVLSC
jgi:hypothetical protein